jgi:uncharacterized 2Fe-2S/4Fe-4S cluster protein (DUF4445 family)
MKQRFKVSIQPDGKTVIVLEGTTIYEALGEAGVIIKSECGGSGVCGSCKVRIIEGGYVQEGSERYLTKEEIEGGTVLACRTRITGDLMVEIPVGSRLFEQKILTAGISTGPDNGALLSPGVRKMIVGLDPISARTSSVSPNPRRASSTGGFRYRCCKRSRRRSGATTGRRLFS